MDQDIDKTLQRAIDNANKAWERYLVGAMSLDDLMKQFVDFTATVGETLRKIYNKKHGKRP